ncbi:MAG: PspA/IM30 family protein [Chloroflexota bacterium]
MSVWTRIRMIFSARTNAALDQIEDPRHTLAYTYERQQELLRQVKRGLVDVSTARHQLQTQINKLNERIGQLGEQAERALSAGREDLARLALQRKQACLAELEALHKQLAEAQEEEHKLTLAEQRFAQRLDIFRTRRDALSARYTAAQAQVHIHEALGSVSKEAADLGAALERAEDKVSRVQARATALDALLEVGSLSSPGLDDSLEQSLNQVASAQAVEAELAALKHKANPEAVA